MTDWQNNQLNTNSQQITQYEIVDNSFDIQPKIVQYPRTTNGILYFLYSNLNDPLCPG